ncbi:fumarylacetoacetate hydrolase family protein [Desulfotomaculum nigrificans]|uniref:fumarylacetoacetate hydrolase family protein n=1 Tax=Desulfotomaculum nigrificans TaxID=1565 RepID=UPI0001FADFF5|nr:fumarylacetoacetate hydrolase family protein [Desulfotomaculum nigrificans]
MKLLQFKVADQLRLGVKTINGVLDVAKAAAELKQQTPITIDKVIQSGEDALRALEILVDKVQGMGEAKYFLNEDAIEYAPCVSNPEKIICVGLNYINHAAESKMDVPKVPILFSKFNNALAGHKDVVHLPVAAQKFDYEAELVVVIGKTAQNVSPAEALSYVFGYTVGNDLSARDLQFRTGQWLLGKTCDQFAPVGPYIVTADELPDPQNLDIKCKVNGVLRQSANTRDMIFNCATIISYVSHHMTLKPGDIIFTGTPDGVIMGYPESQQEWLKSGDEVVISIENIGTLINKLQ